MEALKKKWNSRRGATILLALLFMLVCMMVGSSLLMASASNIGKINSNRDEQQRYLTISSAMTQLCDKLTKAQYVGNYEYMREEVWDLKETGYVDDDGNPIMESYHKASTHSYEQKEGKLSSLDPADTSLNAQILKIEDVLPLRKHMDEVFHETFTVPVSQRRTDPITEHVYVPSGADFGSVTETYRLTVTAEAEGDTDGVYSGLSNPVVIDVELTDGRIVLKAKLGNPENPEYTMEAALKPVTLNDGKDAKLKELLVPDPEGALSKKSGYEIGMKPEPYEPTSTAGTYTSDIISETTPPVTWALEYIKKGTSKDVETPS